MPKFNERVQIYLESKKHTQAPKTFRSNQTRANNLMTAFGRYKVESINEERIQRWINKQHRLWSNKTLNEHFTILRAVFSSAQANGLITRNPMSNIKNLPTTTDEPNPFTLSDIKAIAKLQRHVPNCATSYRSRCNDRAAHFRIDWFNLVLCRL